MKTPLVDRATLSQERRAKWARCLAFFAFLICAALLAPASNAGVTTLYSFTNKFDGSQPYAGLVPGQDGYFYGTCFDGGTNGFGSVYKVSTTGAFTPVYSFSLLDGETPTARLTLGSDGNFYGTTFEGGSNFYFGTIFQISSNGNFNSLYSFTNGLDGAEPYAGLTEGPDGAFYGVASSGGVNNNGIIFQITSSGAFTPVYYFNGTVDGSQPRAALIVATNNLFYGTTFAGGSSGDGVIFSFTTGGVIGPLHSFDSSSDGSNPVGQLSQGANGILFGTAYNGGSNGAGTIFQITTGGAFSVIHTFTGGDDGGNPAAGLLLGGDGNFYGTTYSGGANGDGAIFKITPQGAFTPLYSFTGGNDGASPMSTLAQGSDGNFYGTAQLGGAYHDGAVFEFSATSAPVLTSIAEVSGAIEITWNGLSGQSYQAQYAASLTPLRWFDLGSPVTATNGVASQTDSAPPVVERFYRVYQVP
jgi:uncharacterized repeat protein (TIGR03803 family)